MPSCHSGHHFGSRRFKVAGVFFGCSAVRMALTRYRKFGSPVKESRQRHFPHFELWLHAVGFAIEPVSAPVLGLDHLNVVRIFPRGVPLLEAAFSLKTSAVILISTRYALECRNDSSR